MRSNRHGICEFPLFCYSAASSLFLSYRNIFSLPVTARRFFPSCHSGPFFFICHSGLRAGVQVNIDSLATWIPGQARNDSYMSVIPRLRSNRQGIFEFPPSCHSTAFFPSCHSGPFFLSVTPACFFICHSGLFFYLSLRPPSRSPGQY